MATRREEKQAQEDEGHCVTNGESEGNSDQNGVRANRKRKDQLEEKDEEEQEQERGNDKKPRVIWTRELHNKFLAAVDHVGFKSNVS